VPRLRQPPVASIAGDDQGTAAPVIGEARYGPPWSVTPGEDGVNRYPRGERTVPGRPAG